MTMDKYVVPTKRIISPSDLHAFIHSDTYTLVHQFIEDLSSSVEDTPIKPGIETSQNIDIILRILDSIDQLVTDYPPEETKSRFGNVAFRSFYDALAKNMNEFHTRFTELPRDSFVEVSEYLQQSFGDRERIDYGSGHELNFMCWLLCLRELHILSSTDYKSMILVVFNKYLILTRRIQTLYLLEPAGSHGVWGLDDYSFLPYLFGASQLLHHPHIRPKSIHVAETVEHFSQQYMYLSCIAQINAVKTVGLRWHSPMLDDISGVRTWTKVREGMGKMFRGEVLGKRTVMQHFLFGSIIPPPKGLGEGPREEGGGHIHSEIFGDCCGIRVPSSVVARREMEAKGFKGEGALPFD